MVPLCTAPDIDVPELKKGARTATLVPRACDLGVGRSCASLLMEMRKRNWLNAVTPVDRRRPDRLAAIGCRGLGVQRWQVFYKEHRGGNLDAVTRKVGSWMPEFGGTVYNVALRLLSIFIWSSRNRLEGHMPSRKPALPSRQARLTPSTRTRSSSPSQGSS